LVLRNDRGNRFKPEKEEKHLINEAITSLEVRLIGAEGEQLGVLRTREALRLAEEQGLDLVAVAPNAAPPVCRLLDYGKLKYKEQKKAAESRKKSSTQAVKEIRLRYSTDEHDIETKVRHARKFIQEGDRVRFEMRFRGRESMYQDLGVEIFNKVTEQLQDIAVVDERTPLLGQKMILAFAPKGQGKADGKSEKA
jgi:translation initiation factor IF-3